MLQTCEGIDHGLFATHQCGCTCVCTEFTLSAEPGHHDAGSNAQHDVKHDAGHVISDTGTGVFFVVFTKKAVHRITDDAAEEHHKGVEYALHQCQCDHVAVLYVRDFVRQHRFHLFTRHALQQTGGHRHQSRIAKCAGGEGIRFAFVNSNLGHFQARALRQLFHRINQPCFISTLRLSDDLRACGPLGHGLADQQRNERAAKTHDGGKAEQCGEVQAIGRQKAVHAQQAGDYAQHQHDGKVGDDQKKNAFHEVLLNRPTQSGQMR